MPGVLHLVLAVSRALGAARPRPWAEGVPRALGDPAWRSVARGSSLHAVTVLEPLFLRSDESRASPAESEGMALAQMPGLASVSAVLCRLLGGAGLGAQPWGHCRREGQASGGGAAPAQVERGLPAAPLLRQPPARLSHLRSGLSVGVLFTQDPVLKGILV